MNLTGVLVPLRTRKEDATQRLKKTEGGVRTRGARARSEMTVREHSSELPRHTDDRMRAREGGLGTLAPKRHRVAFIPKGSLPGRQPGVGIWAGSS